MKIHVKSKWLMLAVMAVSISSVQAQKEYRMSVSDAVALALKNTVEIKNLRIDSLKQKAQNMEVTGAALPQVTGSAQVAHYLTLPKILFPSNGETSIYDVLNREGVKDGNGNPIAPKQEFTECYCRCKFKSVVISTGSICWIDGT